MNQRPGERRKACFDLCASEHLIVVGKARHSSDSVMRERQQRYDHEGLYHIPIRRLITRLVFGLTAIFKKPDLKEYSNKFVEISAIHAICTVC